MYNNEHFAQPPPAHMGIPPVHIDPKSGKKIICKIQPLKTTTSKAMWWSGRENALWRN